MCRIGIIGAGVSGLTLGQELKDKYKVCLFEKESKPGGLIRCIRAGGSLFHTCGGHVFNTKKKNISEWFWSHFEQNGEFAKADRNSVVFMKGGEEIPYPIENHVYLFNHDFQKNFYEDLVHIAKNSSTPTNFEEFLLGRFGKTLYEHYFQPYNKKVWRRDLKKVPLSWLEGKLPMPTVEEMIFNNVNHVKEREFVHSSFWYEKQDGSQFLANRLAEGLDIRYNAEVYLLERKKGKWYLNNEMYDKIVFCGNLKQLPLLLKSVDLKGYSGEITKLDYHGTTAVFCEIDKNPYSWIYLPSKEYEAHRIICTGNFSDNNNAVTLPNNRITATIEFTDEICKDDIMANLRKIPLHPKYITHKYNQYTYPIQDNQTREMISSLKKELAYMNFFFSGRFADWEYYNMDVAMDAAISVAKMI